MEVEQLTPWLILWRFEIFNGAVINDSVALFEIRRNEDEFPRRVIHVVDSSAGLPRPHDCVADFDVQWYLAPLILDLTSSDYVNSAENHSAKRPEKTAEKAVGEWVLKSGSLLDGWGIHVFFPLSQNNLVSP